MNPTAPPQRDEPRMLWIGLPAYNEEATIAALFARFLEVFPGKSMPYRIVLYNDGSRSPTRNPAIMPSVTRRLRLARNQMARGSEITLIAMERPIATPPVTDFFCPINQPEKRQRQHHDVGLPVWEINENEPGRWQQRKKSR